MEDNYLLNPMVHILHSQVEHGSTENYTQALVENILWTEFPAQKGWSTVTKHRQGATEPDNKVMKIIHYNAGPSPRDVIMVEVKRGKDNLQLKHFNDVATTQLADHMSESVNPVGSKLFGVVVIGTYIAFYDAILEQSGAPRNVRLLYQEFFEIILDAGKIQEFWNHVKENIPGDPSALPMGTIATVPSYSPAGPPAGTSVASAGPSQDVLPAQYYYVQDELFYYSNNGSITHLSSRPRDVWIYHRLGWSATGRTKKWRKWDGRHDTYE